MTHAIFPAFKNDVFVSYARDDDKPLGGAQGWVTKVLKELGAMTPTYGGYRLDRLCFDRDDLVSSGDLREMIASEIDNSGLMMMFLSAAYLKSPHCLFELNHFFARADFAPQRVLIVERDNCLVDYADSILARAEQEQRSLLDKVIGFAKDQRRFLFWENVLGEPRPLGLDFNNDPAEQSAFMRKVDELARGFSKTVRLLESSPPPAAGAPSAPPAPAPTPGVAVKEGQARVFLALAPDELRANRDQIAQRLAKRGDCVVAPLESTTLWPRLRDPAAFEAEIKPLIASLQDGPSLFVQLIGSGAGAKESLPEPFIHTQFRLARERSVRMMILRNLNRETADFCPADAEIFKSVATIDETVPSFLNRLDAAIDALLAVKARPAAAASSNLVFLNAAPEDYRLAREVAETLRGRFDIFLPSESVSGPKDAAEETEESYCHCDEAVLLRVNAAPSWSNAQLRRFARIRHRRPKPIRHLALVQHRPTAAPPSVMVQGLLVREFDGAPEATNVAQQIAGVLS